MRSAILAGLLAFAGGHELELYDLIALLAVIGFAILFWNGSMRGHL